MLALPHLLTATLLSLAPQSPSGTDPIAHGGGPVADAPIDLEPEEPARRLHAERESRDYDAIWTVAIENDSFVGTDSNYTSGFAISRTSREIGTYGPNSFHRRVVDWASFLPGVGDENCENFLLFAVGQSMFTPDDIEVSNPLPDERPYAGVLFLDTTILSRAEDVAQVWNLKLGVVGPSSGAEHAQRGIHELLGGDEPMGWDHQLHDEPILNVDYQYGQLWKSGELGDRFEYQLMPNVGAAFGNYATFANVGLGGRIGFNMPDLYGSNSVRAGTNNSAKIASPPSERWSGYLYGSVQAFGVGWFLPLDGNTWKDSPSVDSEDLIGIATVGVGLGKGGYLVGLSFSAGSDTYEGQEDRNEWGALSLTWSR